jgi:hypothetical protein
MTTYGDLKKEKKGTERERKGDVDSGPSPPRYLLPSIRITDTDSPNLHLSNKTFVDMKVCVTSVMMKYETTISQSKRASVMEVI